MPPFLLKIDKKGMKMSEIKLTAKEIYKQIYNLSQIKKIDQAEVVEAFKNTVTKLITETYDEEADLEFIFDQENDNFAIINHNKVVVGDPITSEEKDRLTRCIEIPLSDAKKIDPNAEIGDSLSQEINFEYFSKKDYNKILANFSQDIKNLERKMTCEKYASEVGNSTKAKIVSVNKGKVNLELRDGTLAFMPSNFVNQRIISKLNPGDWIDVVIEEVKEENSNAQIIVSSVESRLLQKLFEIEIPEISQGLISIVNIARISGERAKVSIKKSNDAPETMEEIGAIMGRDSERISTISRKLNGEKIDVVLYSDDIKVYIKNALSPAKVIDLIEVPSKNSYPSFNVIVPTIQHTLAIGKKGQNVSLASELVKAKLDILSQEQADERGIEYNFENGNITKEEIELLESGKKLHHSFKHPRTIGNKNATNKFNTFENSFNIDEFDEDLAEMRRKAQQNDNIFERQMFSNSLDEDLERTLSELNDDKENNVDENDLDPYSKSFDELNEQKNDEEEDYEKITATKMKDFKRDEDLSSGLENIDLSDLDDEKW
ncbi:transcription termination factor NusA [Metamycoplasma hominis]|uniref:transcription termination factor NusA n=1 Tax=Metamycoplasma hominis TaxID=2098 RepID=UPI0024112BA8|nr:transcription termination factor NusA [Metamycoplasma hominis]